MGRECVLRRAWRALAERGVSALVHQPALLRRLGAALRRWPVLAQAAGAAASRDEVVAAFDRVHQFSSTAHRPNLAAGEFLIGLASGPQHAAQRRVFSARLPAASTFASEAAAESRTRLAAWRQAPGEVVDLVGGYMAPIALRCLLATFGGHVPRPPDDDPLIGHLRHLGAHLIVGGVATEAVRERARVAAIEVDAWVRQHLPAIRQVWPVHASEPPTEEALVRDAIGLLWVGHPASVQALALVVLDLLPRPQWAALADAAQQLESKRGDPWGDPELRGQAMGHVLESLRFRPPFPMLRRDVVRDGHLPARPARPVRGGTGFTLLGIAAMFDPAAHAGPVAADGYDPQRPWHDPADRHLMFGHGERVCPARDPVVAMLTSALIGLCLVPRLRFADPWWRRFELDGPVITRLRVRQG